MDTKEVMQLIETELKIQGKSSKTVKMYKFFNQKFLEFKNKDPKSMKESDVKEYLAYLISDGKYDSGSVALVRSALKFFYDGILKKKIMVDIKTPKIHRKIPDVLTREEVRKLIDSSKTLRNKLLIEFMYAGGLRVSECANLKIEDLNLEEKTGLLKKGKGGKDRFFILSEQLVEDLKEYLRHRDKGYVFPGDDGAITVRAIERVIERIAKKTNIKKRVYCHGLRHAFATHLLDDGIDIRLIQELLAHSNLQTTQFYTQVSKEQLKKIKSPLDRL